MAGVDADHRRLHRQSNQQHQQPGAVGDGQARKARAVRSRGGMAASGRVLRANGTSNTAQSVSRRERLATWLGTSGAPYTKKVNARPQVPQR